MPSKKSSNQKTLITILIAIIIILALALVIPLTKENLLTNPARGTATQHSGETAMQQFQQEIRVITQDKCLIEWSDCAFAVNYNWAICRAGGVIDWDICDAWQAGGLDDCEAAYHACTDEEHSLEEDDITTRKVFS